MTSSSDIPIEIPAEERIEAAIEAVNAAVAALRALLAACKMPAYTPPAYPVVLGRSAFLPPPPGWVYGYDGGLVDVHTPDEFYSNTAE